MTTGDDRNEDRLKTESFVFFENSRFVTTEQEQ